MYLHASALAMYTSARAADVRSSHPRAGVRVQVDLKCCHSRSFGFKGAQLDCAYLSVEGQCVRGYHRGALESTQDHVRRLAEQYELHVRHPIVLETGRIAMLGEPGGTGHRVVVQVRADRRLDILDILREAQMYRLQEPLKDRAPYHVTFNGKHYAFQATHMWPLLGVCSPDPETTLLLSSVEGGLMLTWDKEGGGCDSRVVDDWRVPFNVVREARPKQASRPAKRVAGRPGQPPHAHVEAVKAEYTRLASDQGLKEALEAFDLYIDHLARHAIPDPRLGGRKALEDAPAVLAGLREAAAKGCLRLYGRETAIRAQLAGYGVDLPERSVAPVLRLLIGLGCVFVSRAPSLTDRDFSKRYVVELGAAIDPENPMHLAVLRATPRPRRTDAEVVKASVATPPPTPVAVAAAGNQAKDTSPDHPAAPAVALRQFMAATLMLMLSRDAVEECGASLTAQAPPGVAVEHVPAPSVPREVTEAPPSVPREATEASKLQVPPPSVQPEVSEQRSFAAAIDSAQHGVVARLAEAVEGHAWHTLDWPRPHGAPSSFHVDPPLIGDMQIELGRRSQTDETLGALPWPASVRLLRGVGCAQEFKFICGRAAEQARSRGGPDRRRRCDANPRGPPRRHLHQ
jgi:hypothetical protein